MVVDPVYTSKRTPTTKPPSSITLTFSSAILPFSMFENREIVIEKAIEALKSGQYNSELIVAKAFNVPRSTVRCRLMGMKDRREAINTNRDWLRHKRNSLFLG